MLCSHLFPVLLGGQVPCLGAAVLMEVATLRQMGVGVLQELVDAGAVAYHQLARGQVAPPR